MDELPDHARTFGLCNVRSCTSFCFSARLTHVVAQFGNTCYFNSVLQALYACVPFREALIAHKSTQEDLVETLQELFVSISSNKKKTGSLTPKRFYARLRKDNGATCSCACRSTCLLHQLAQYHVDMFNSDMQQDAQEFLNFLLNHIAHRLTPGLLSVVLSALFGES